MADSPARPPRFDVAVVGAGPAGISAAINVRNRSRSVVLLGGKVPFGRVDGPHAVANYAGFPAASGDELAAAFRRHLDAFAIAVTPEKVTKIVRDEDGFVLFGAGEFYEARTVVLATGVHVGSSIDGEEELVGQGVSYCVTCDGRLFAGRRVAYVSYGPPGEEEASELAEAFGTGVVYLPQYDADYRLAEGVEVRRDATPVRLGRSDDGVHVALGDDELIVDGVFFYKEAVAPRALLDGLDVTGSHLVADRQLRTSVPGVFAAGDCTGEPYQVAKAVGEGQVAALGAVRLLRGGAGRGDAE